MMIDDSMDLKKMDFSFFGKGSVLNGTFSLKGVTHLNAKFDGNITMEDRQPFILEDEGVFTGTLKGHDVDVSGKFEGTLMATGKVTIRSTAEISGEIEARQLVIHPGSQVNIKADTEEGDVKKPSKN